MKRLFGYGTSTAPAAKVETPVGSEVSSKKLKTGTKVTELTVGITATPGSDQVKDAKRAAEIERNKLEEAPARWANAYLDPREFVGKGGPTEAGEEPRRPGKEIWDEQFGIFLDALTKPDATIDNIMREYLLDFERELLTPIGERRKNPAKFRIQHENKKREKEWLENARLKHLVAGGGQLETIATDKVTARKLTMAYFGMPVGPFVLLPSLQGAETSSDEEDEDAEQAGPGEGPLRFLNSYDSRVFGRDAVLRECGLHFALTCIAGMQLC